MFLLCCIQGHCYFFVAVFCCFLNEYNAFIKKKKKTKSLQTTKEHWFYTCWIQQTKPVSFFFFGSNKTSTARVIEKISQVVNRNSRFNNCFIKASPRKNCFLTVYPVNPSINFFFFNILLKMQINGKSPSVNLPQLARSSWMRILNLNNGLLIQILICLH